MIGIDIVLYGLLAAWLDNIIPTGKSSGLGLQCSGSTQKSNMFFTFFKLFNLIYQNIKK
jgi:hypothetical protein